MTFQQMQYVLQVYQSGSVSAAAKKLFVGQSSVSLSISSLERELGYPVFYRLKNGFIPTPRGREVINQAARICESYRIITGPEQTGPKKICIVGGNIECCRKASLRLMDEMADRKDIYFQFADSGRIPPIQQVALFELDLWFKFAFAQQMPKLTAQFRDKGLTWIELAEFPVAIYLGPGHRLYHEEKLDIPLLEDEYFIDTARRSLASNAVINSVIAVRPDRILAVEDPNLRKRLLEAGFGYTIKPVLHREQDGVRRIPFGDYKIKLLAIYNPARPMRPETARYLELVQEELASGGYVT